MEAAGRGPADADKRCVVIAEVYQVTKYKFLFAVKYPKALPHAGTDLPPTACKERPGAL